jgi:hypothetical protein
MFSEFNFTDELLFEILLLNLQLLLLDKVFIYNPSIDSLFGCNFH